MLGPPAYADFFLILALAPSFPKSIWKAQDVSGVPDELLWRWIFGVGVILSALGLVLRYFTTKAKRQ